MGWNRRPTRSECGRNLLSGRAGLHAARPGAAGWARPWGWVVRTAAGRCRHARAGGSDGAARELGAVVTCAEERGGKEEGLTDWHSGVGARWLARDHGMGRSGARPARRQRLRAVVPRLSGKRGAKGAAPDLVSPRGSDDTVTPRHLGPPIGGWTRRWGRCRGGMTGAVVRCGGVRKNGRWRGRL
jgi:hypothetical protein